MAFRLFFFTLHMHVFLNSLHYEFLLSVQYYIPIIGNEISSGKKIQLLPPPNTKTNQPQHTDTKEYTPHTIKTSPTGNTTLLNTHVYREREYIAKYH